MYAPNQWETTLHYNAASHWLRAYTKWSLPMAIHHVYKVVSHRLVWLKTGVVLHTTRENQSQFAEDKFAGIVLCIHPANERRRYIVTSSIIGWVHTQNSPWVWHLCLLHTAPGTTALAGGRAMPWYWIQARQTWHTSSSCHSNQN